MCTWCRFPQRFILFSVLKGLENKSENATKTTPCAHSLRPRTHGNVFLRFCIVPSNELVVLASLENSKQYKKAGKRFRVHGAYRVSTSPTLLNLIYGLLKNIFLLLLPRQPGSFSLSLRAGQFLPDNNIIAMHMQSACNIMQVYSNLTDICSEVRIIKESCNN